MAEQTWLRVDMHGEQGLIVNVWSPSPVSPEHVQELAAIVGSIREIVEQSRRPAPSGVDVEAVIEHIRAEYKRECWGTLLPELEMVIRTALSAEAKAGGV